MKSVKTIPNINFRSIEEWQYFFNADVNRVPWVYVDFRSPAEKFMHKLEQTVTRDEIFKEYDTWLTK